MSSQEKWPVEIFRYSSNNGWELYQQARSTKVAKTANGGKGKNTKGSVAQPQKTKQGNDDEKEQEEGVTAAPRRGCVEVKKLRLRIHLFEKNNQKTSGNGNGSGSGNGSSSDIGSNTSSKAHTTVVRRRDTILLSSRRGLGAVVLKFRNVTECIAFSDKLIGLNSDHVFNQIEDKTLQRPSKRVNISSKGDSGNNNTTTTTNITDTSTPSNDGTRHEEINGNASRTTNQSTEGNNAIRSYIVRLLHDEDFLDFVDNVENSLVTAPDCSRILEALGHPRRASWV